MARQEKKPQDYPTEPQIEEMWRALESEDDQQIREVLRKRRLERMQANLPSSPSQK